MYFEKVPYSEYEQACVKLTDAKVDEDFLKWLKLEWENIKLPTRATSGSAGYDFYLPTNANFIKDVPVTIPTGIRVHIDPGWFLMLLPRSGLGFKNGMRLENTCGIIDEDYYNADNFGHIMAKISVSKDIFLQPGDRFMQGVFVPYGIVNYDNVTSAPRTGGFGSTGV